MSQDAEPQPDLARLARDESVAVRAALLELVLLKDMKTREGETDEYRVRRERAWIEARRALALAEKA